MQALIILTLCTATLMDFAAESKAVPGLLRFTPEMLSVIIVGLVFFKALRGGLSIVPNKYWFAFGFLAFVIVCGIFANSVDVGPLLAGMRYYLRAIPLFFLPAVANFSPKQIQQQVKVVLAIAFIQVPIAIFQRYTVMAEGRMSGDDVRGTVADSGVLSIILICVVVILTAYCMRGYLRRLPFLLMFFILLIPTTINETKATVVFLPLGLMATLIAASAPGKRIKVAIGGVALLAAFAAILIPVFTAMNAQGNSAERRESLVDFFGNEQRLNGYINDKKDVGLGTRRLVGRGTAIAFPLRYLSQDPLHLAFGLGIGNASHSSLGENFTGKYYELFQYFVVSAAAVFLIELGMIGTLLVVVLYWLVFTDAIAVMKADTEKTGAIAAGWVGVVAVMGIAEFYNVTHGFASLSYLYWYFAGIVVARRGQLILQQSVAAAPRPAPQRIPIGSR